MAEKLTSLPQKRVILWHVLAESYNICHYWSWWWVWDLVDTPSCMDSSSSCNDVL